MVTHVCIPSTWEVEVDRGYKASLIYSDFEACLDDLRAWGKGNRSKQSRMVEAGPCCLGSKS